MKEYGYMRVSSKEQNEHRQLIALTAFGVRPERIYMDKQSGKDFNRAQYQKLARATLRAGDVLVVKSIDRLGRNYNEILAEWRYITKDVGADIVVLDMPLLDTRRRNDLTGTLIADIVLQILSYVAQCERENITRRQAEGIQAAKARGVKFGRPPREIPPTFLPVYKQWKNKELSHTEAERQLGVTKMKFYRLVWQFEQTAP